MITWYGNPESFGQDLYIGRWHYILALAGHQMHHTAPQQNHVTVHRAPMQTTDYAYRVRFKTFYWKK